MEDALDDLDDLDDFDDDLKWSWRYVSLCLLIPTFNGFINGYCWAGLSLHYREMSWSIARVGTASTCGFIGRIVGQKIQVRYGVLSTFCPISMTYLKSTTFFRPKHGSSFDWNNCEKKRCFLEAVKLLFKARDAQSSGFWVMIPLGLIHLMLTILGVIFFDQEPWGPKFISGQRSAVFGSELRMVPFFVDEY